MGHAVVRLAEGSEPSRRLRGRLRGRLGLGGDGRGRPRRPGIAAVVATITLLVAACSLTPAAPSLTPAPDPSRSLPVPTASATVTPDADAVYRRIADQVSTIRQLVAPTRVEPTTIDEATLRTNLTSEFNASNPPVDVANAEQLLKTMSLLAPDASLRRLYLDLQGSQVIGYYDPKVKQLFIVSRSGALGPIEEVTYAHEFTHELQDRHFDLNTLGLDTLKDDSDRALAALALVEGDAVSVQTSWMSANLTAADLGQVATQASDPAMLAVLAGTPKILLETSLFPYQAGAAFVGQLISVGGYSRVDAAYLHPPVSTQQILHPDAYVAGKLPLDLRLPSDLATRFGAGWGVAAQDTFGELQTRVWLREGGVVGDTARLTADGWAGDRLGLLRGPAGTSAVVWSTAWDTVSHAQAFESAARTAVAGLHLDALISSSGTRVALVIRGAGGPDDERALAILAAVLSA